MEKVLKLKKYPNRRIYNPETSTYITLNEVSELIKNGRHVEIIDKKTNEDVTSITLTQIVMEQVKSNQIIFPVSLLHLIIQFGENILRDFFEKYLEKFLENYVAYKNNFDEQFKRYLELGMDFSNLARNISPFQTFINSTMGKSTNSQDKDSPSSNNELRSR